METGCIDRVLEITSSTNTSSVKLDHVTIRGGRLPGGFFFGAGIFMNGTGSLEIVDSTFTDNESCSDGAAIDMEGGSSAEFELDGSTIADNTSQRGYGGAAWLFDVRHDRELHDHGQRRRPRNCVRVPASRAAVRRHRGQQPDHGTSCTIVAPVSLSDIASGDAQHADAHAGDVDAAALPDQAQLLAFDLTSFGSVLTGDIPNCDAATLLHTDSNGYNRASDSTCRLDGKEDEQHVDDPGLGDLADNGGPTKTLLPEKDSELLDEIPIDRCSGPDDAVDEDQRGVHRPRVTAATSVRWRSRSGVRW